MGIRMLCAGLLLAAFALPASAQGIAGNQGIAGKWNAKMSEPVLIALYDITGRIAN